MAQPTETHRGRRAGGAVLTAALLLHTWLLAAARAAKAVSARARRSEQGVIAEYVAMGAFGVVTAVALWALMKALGVDVIEFMRKNILGDS
ncbi:MAG: hypothetical protein M3Q48_14480 [Actinomycetota bacterium]|nr:hypothetical protein [Actinomycetota bacterium]